MKFRDFLKFRVSPFLQWTHEKASAAVDAAGIRPSGPSVPGFEPITYSTADFASGPVSNSHSPQSEPLRTFEGSPAFAGLSPGDSLARSVMSCMLWEDEFYEDGESIAARIERLAAQVDAEYLATLAIMARDEFRLRHVPLWLLVQQARKGGRIVSETIEKTVRRADEPGELIALYWKDGKKPLPKQMKLGLAAALRKFDAYQLAKYDRAGSVRLRDVLFLTHAKPADEAQAALWKLLADDELPAPDTWEVALSAGKDKKETFTRLLQENRLGYLALLRNLRNMTASKVDPALIERAIMARRGAKDVLPFRYVAAARACPSQEPALDIALAACLADPEMQSSRNFSHKRTIVLVDVSGSMDTRLSGKSDLKRMDAAATLAAIFPATKTIYSFSNEIAEIPPRSGMACIDAILKSQAHGGTELAKAVAFVNGIPHERLIVITDEQSTDGRVPAPVVDDAYMINVASYRNGVGYGKWRHIDGFSESVIRWIMAYERAFSLPD